MCRYPALLVVYISALESPTWKGRIFLLLCLTGKSYLYMKTIERAHSPKNLWQRIKLKKNYQQVCGCVYIPHKIVFLWRQANVQDCWRQ